MRWLAWGAATTPKGPKSLIQSTGWWHDVELTRPRITDETARCDGVMTCLGQAQTAHELGAVRMLRSATRSGARAGGCCADASGCFR